MCTTYIRIVPTVEVNSSGDAMSCPILYLLLRIRDVGQNVNQWERGDSYGCMYFLPIPSSTVPLHPPSTFSTRSHTIMMPPEREQEFLPSL
eukprot:548998-Hanusia_phi.AAC.7